MENNKCDVLNTKQQIHKHFKWNEDMQILWQENLKCYKSSKFDPTLSNIKHVQISRAS